MVFPYIDLRFRSVRNWLVYIYIFKKTNKTVKRLHAAKTQQIDFEEAEIRNKINQLAETVTRKRISHFRLGHRTVP